jgi:hypothetical protein
MRVASGMLTVQGRILSHPPLVLKDKASGVATCLDLVSQHVRTTASIADSYTRARTRANKGQ